MSAERQARILVIDDERQDGIALRRAVGRDANVDVKEPDQFAKKDLVAADLILVDYELGEWTAANADLAAPPSGLSLSAVIRDQLERGSRPRATGIALYSGRVDEISATLPVEVRGFAVARLNNLEWVFEKHDRTAPVAVVSLAEAIASLPGKWPEDAVRATRKLHELLSLDPKVGFFGVAAEDVAACHPPIHELSTATHALSVIRWLAQRILAYPAFLMNDVGLAARLRLDPDELRRLLDGSDLGKELSSVKYKGVLSDLVGPHWWRAGVDQLIFEWTDGAGGVAQLKEAIENRTDAATVLAGDYVPVIDDTYRATKIAVISDAVRVRPDDWPPFADEAWTRTEWAAESERLRGLVLPADTRKLG